MFEINYNFSDDNSSDVTQADETVLRYSHFLGSVILKNGNNSVSINWDWIPLLDFALCLITIFNNLVQKIKGEEEFEFTESEAKIIFQKDGDRIKIITSFSDEILEMRFEDFQKTIKKFYKDVIFDILGKNQGLRNNTTFLGYLKEAQKM
jgi:hypothetical protein